MTSLPCSPRSGVDLVGCKSAAEPDWASGPIRRSESPRRLEIALGQWDIGDWPHDIIRGMTNDGDGDQARPLPPHRETAAWRNFRAAPNGALTAGANRT